jgi:hypothetical protein
MVRHSRTTSRAELEAVKLLDDLFTLWRKAQEGNFEADLRRQLLAILRDDDGQVLRDMRQLFETDSDTFADSVRNWVEDCRQLEV